MLRKNQDEKKLKLNQPILSVRRNSSQPCGKDENRERESDSLRSVSQPATLYRSESKLDPVRNPGVVPFVWEESPGKPKNGIKTEKPNQLCFDKAIERLTVTNKEEEEESVSRVKHSDKLIRKFGSFNSSKDYEISESGDEDENEEYKAKFVFLDCKSQEPERTCTQSRDFKIGLFLPANKKIPSELPIYTSPGKQAVVHEELPRQRKNVTEPGLQFESSFAWRDEGNNRHEAFPGKVCGAVPRLCVRSSVFILNPVPAMSVKTRGSTSPAGSRMQGYSFARSCTGDDINHRKPPQTCEVKSVFPVQGFGGHAGHEALRSCKKFCKKLQELLADHTNSMQEQDSGNHVVESDSPLTKMRKGDKPEPFVQETAGFDLQKFNVKSGRNPVEKAYGKRYEVEIASLESDNELDESYIKQEIITRKVKNLQDTNLEFPASPPLPKTPSDSWLFRTLPLLSPKASPSRPYLGTEGPRNTTSEVKKEMEEARHE